MDDKKPGFWETQDFSHTVFRHTLSKGANFTMLPKYLYGYEVTFSGCNIAFFLGVFFRSFFLLLTRRVCFHIGGGRTLRSDTKNVLLIST